MSGSGDSHLRGVSPIVKRAPLQQRCVQGPASSVNRAFLNATTVALVEGAAEKPPHAPSANLHREGREAILPGIGDLGQPSNRDYLITFDNEDFSYGKMPCSA